MAPAAAAFRPGTPPGEGQGEGGDSETHASWYLKDNLGSVRDVVQSDGTKVQVLDHLVYDAFGNITSQTPAANQPRQTFAGYVWDAEAGLYYCRKRWYDAQTGRFSVAFAMLVRSSVFVRGFLGAAAFAMFVYSVWIRGDSSLWKAVQ
jgi:hypothetical protein